MDVLCSGRIRMKCVSRCAAGAAHTMEVSIGDLGRLRYSTLDFVV